MDFDQNPVQTNASNSSNDSGKSAPTSNNVDPANQTSGAPMTASASPGSSSKTDDSGSPEMDLISKLNTDSQSDTGTGSDPTAPQIVSDDDPTPSQADDIKSTDSDEDSVAPKAAGVDETEAVKKAVEEALRSSSTAAGSSASSPNPDTTWNDQKPETSSQPTASKASTGSQVLMAAGPLFLVFSLVTSLLIVSRPNPTTNPVNSVVSNDETVVKGVNDESASGQAPFNPDSVRAYSDRLRRLALESGQPNYYPNPYFTWQNGQVTESGAQIVGYNVYFGPQDYNGNVDEHPLTAVNEYTVFVTGNEFSPADYGLNLQPGSTYYLMVQTVTNGQHPAGYDRVTRSPSITYFTYTYE